MCMGEKGNLTSEELAAASTTVGGVVASALTDAGETIRDKVMDKAADAGVEEARERLHRGPEEGPPSGLST